MIDKNVFRGANIAGEIGSVTVNKHYHNMTVNIRVHLKSQTNCCSKVNYNTIVSASLLFSGLWLRAFSSLDNQKSWKRQEGKDQEILAMSEVTSLVATEQHFRSSMEGGGASLCRHLSLRKQDQGRRGL